MKVDSNQKLFLIHTSKKKLDEKLIAELDAAVFKMFDLTDREAKHICSLIKQISVESGKEDSAA